MTTPHGSGNNEENIHVVCGYAKTQVNRNDTIPNVGMVHILICLWSIRIRSWSRDADVTSRKNSLVEQKH